MYKNRKIRLGIFLTVCFGTSFLLITQVKAQKRSKNSPDDPNTFPEWVQPTIPGAPKLGKPQLIMGESMPAMSKGMGWAAPAVYDWNGDGKKDLLIGEFGSGLENEGMVVGNFVRVYENQGTDDAPAFSDMFSYARGLQEEVPHSTGTPLSVFTWCCLAFTPRFVDLNHDGYEDLVTGQFNPGYVTWFQGSENGFWSGERLEQVGDPLAALKQFSHHDLPITDSRSYSYWRYSSVAFGDFDGDEKEDMIVGGSAIRISKNIGTKYHPKFGEREVLLDTNGDPLRVRQIKEEEKESGAQYALYAGTGITVPYVVDWDSDGVLDLLITDNYSDEGSAAVKFFRGVNTEEGIRFEPGVALFSAKDGGKAFPGAWLNVCVTDWNNDGVNDLIVGASVATLNGGKFNHELSWQWESKTGISKQNQAYTQNFYKKMYVEPSKQWYEETRMKLGLSMKEMEEKYGKLEAQFPKGYKEDDPYVTLAHQGYVYVMLGEIENE